MESGTFFFFFFFQAEDGIRDVERSRGLGDVYRDSRSIQRVQPKIQHFFSGFWPGETAVVVIRWTETIVVVLGHNAVVASNSARDISSFYRTTVSGNRGCSIAVTPPTSGQSPLQLLLLYKPPRYPNAPSQAPSRNSSFVLMRHTGQSVLLRWRRNR